MRSLFLLVLLSLANAAPAQELSLLAGGLRQSGTNQSSPVWAIDYQHALSENVVGSFTWLNEGHVPGHHRDGQAVQLWGRSNLLDRRLSLAIGIGPYRYFDTTVASSTGDYANSHGWGSVASLAATYYTGRRWLYQARYNRIVAHNSIDTSALMFGIGYQLEPVDRRGPQGSVPYQAGKTTADEVTLLVGRTIVNSYDSQHSSAWAIEYRHGLGRHIDVTLGALNEGDARLVRRDGLTSQIWAVREVLASDQLILGIGLGPYLSVNRYRPPAPGEDGHSKLSWIFTATAAYRLGPRWDARLSWSRIDTNYNRDTDVVLFGAGYRF